jgi:hypothetical protein
MFNVTVFIDAQGAAWDAFSGEHDEILASMKNYPAPLLDKIDDATRDLYAETIGAQKTIWHHPYSVEVRKA